MKLYVLICLVYIELTFKYNWSISWVKDIVLICSIFLSIFIYLFVCVFCQYFNLNVWIAPDKYFFQAIPWLCKYQTR